MLAVHSDFIHEFYEFIESKLTEEYWFLTALLTKQQRVTVYEVINIARYKAWVDSRLRVKAYSHGVITTHTKSYHCFRRRRTLMFVI